MRNSRDIESDEEEYALWFFQELKLHGFVEEIILKPKPFLLFDQVDYTWLKPKPTKKEPNRVEEKTGILLEGMLYTTDIEIHWTEKARGIFFDIHHPQQKGNGRFIAYLDSPTSPIKSYIEVKPAFDDNNMTMYVILKHKWVFQKYGYYVNMFIKEKVMPKLFTPQRYILNQVYQKTYTNKKTGKVHLPGTSKIRWKVRTLEEYLKQF